MRRAAALLFGLLLPLGALAETPVAETPVRVRVGDHAAYGRVVFDWPARTGYQVEEAEGRIVLRFAAPAAFDLAAVRRPPRNVSAIEHEAGRVVTIGIAPGTRPRVFRLGTRIVVDVLNAAAAPPARATQPRTSAAGPARTAPEPPPRPASAAPSSPAAPASASPASAPAPSAPAATAPAATLPLPPLQPAAPSSAPAAAPPTVPARVPAAPPPPAAIAARPADAAGFTIPAPAGVGAALLQRGGAWLLVLDAPLSLDLAPLAGGRLAGAEVIHSQVATLLRLPLSAFEEPLLTRRPEGWHIGGMEAQPAPSAIRPELDPGPPARLLLRAARPAASVAVLDPETGGTLLVGTVREGGEATPIGRRAATFEILPTRLGAAILPRADTVTLRALDTGFAASPGPGAELALGAEPPAENGTASLSRMFDLPEEPVAALVRRERNAALAVAGAQPLARGLPRLRHAEALLALGLGPEAQTLMKLAMQEDPRLAQDPRAHALHGAAALLAGRPEEAEGLLHRRLPENDEITLWRGLLAAARGEDGAARIAAALPLLRAWPEPLRNRLGPLAAEVLVEAGEMAAAQRLLAGREEEAAFALARAMLLEARGEKDAAIAAYQAVAQGRDRRARAAAMRRGVELRLASGALDAAGAAAAMEAVLAVWRGDARERDTRLRLAELRMQAKDPRGAFEALREVAEHFPDVAPAIRPRQVEALLAAIVEEPPVAAVALFDTHVALLPAGEQTERALGVLAERLAALDLVDRARTVLGRALARAGSAESRARLGLRLAGLALGSGDAAGARKALADTTASDLPEPLRQERLLTEARALARLGEAGQAAARYREVGPQAAGELAELLAAAHDWAGAAEAMRAHLAAILPPAPEPLDEPARRLVARAAALLALAGDEAGLAALRDAEAARMADGAFGNTFGLMTADRISSVEDLPRLRRELDAARQLPARLAARP
ncbi:MAG TPA: hypothetical protein VGN83_21220 [Falsiroseomonas sp.]|jgi:hypothetical protein|nr:hypothetical protein [Falsiroseomonas sp.]